MQNKQTSQTCICLCLWLVRLDSTVTEKTVSGLPAELEATRRPAAENNTVQ